MRVVRRWVSSVERFVYLRRSFIGGAVLIYYVHYLLKLSEMFDRNWPRPLRLRKSD